MIRMRPPERVDRMSLGGVWGGEVCETMRLWTQKVTQKKNLKREKEKG